MAKLAQFLARLYPPMTTTERLQKDGRLNENCQWTFSEPFPHPFHRGFYREGAEPNTLMDLKMMKVSAEIRSEAGWLEKRRDPAVIEKWKHQALQEGLTEAQTNFVIAELDYYDALKTGTLESSVVDGVWQTDDLFPLGLKEALVHEVAKLEDIPDSHKDWLPGSNKQILCLVDPSLYCIVFGVTRRVPEPAIPALDFIGGGEVIPPPDITIPNCCGPIKEKYSRSKKYQWLPSDFWVSDTGEVEIKSYINNLHPGQNANLYGILATVFQEVVPLLNPALTYIVNGHPVRIDVDSYNWYTPRPKNRREFDSDGEEIAYGEFEGRDLIFPDAPIFQMPDPLITNSVSLCGRTLQVIVEMKNIVLTPDNPVYPGEPWQVYGMENELIVAAALYYYKIENMKESTIHFRQGISEPGCRQYDFEGVRQIYGLVDGDPLNQYWGGVPIRGGRCIAFPNIFQHRVDSFELKDETKPGLCKMLAFYVVDPAVRILSSLNVPPQQKSWYMHRLHDIEPFKRLPLEILQKIMGYLPWDVSLEAARCHREELLKERNKFTCANNENYFERRYKAR